MNNWSDITDIFNWFPLEINSFAKTYNYEYKGANYIKHGYLAFDGPEKCVRLYTAKNTSHLSYVIVTKKIKEFSSLVDVPVIAGGLIETEEEMRAALEAGASVVSTGETGLWSIKL